MLDKIKYYAMKATGGLGLYLHPFLIRRYMKWIGLFQLLNPSKDKVAPFLN
jgi:hypothetical protein